MPAKGDQLGPADYRFEAGLLLGSNISPEFHLPAAVERIGALGTVARLSDVWQSAPVGYIDQPDFFNTALLLDTDLSREDLRQQLRRIEDSLGRVRDPSNKNAPRTIDIDIAMWGIHGDIASFWTDPDIAQRLFAAVPFAAIVPNSPIGGERLIDIAERLRARDAETLRLVHRPDIRLPFDC
jgi:2-amino-4-hydroxy-6-hydroxymethyldihydropteridine diphosphokinase